MNNSLETSRIVTGSLFIIASIAVAFILNFAQPFLVPLVIALLIRILIDPIIDYQIDYLHVHRIVAVFVSLCLIVFLFIIIVPFIGSSVITFLQSADDYNNKVLILIDLAISELKQFNIDKDELKFLRLNLEYGHKCRKSRKLFKKATGFDTNSEKYKRCVLSKGVQIND